MNSNLTDQLIDICKSLHRQGFLAAADGNVSYRQGDVVRITPSGVAKSAIAAGDLAEVALDGTVLSGRPSSEKLMHLAIYQQCPLAKAVVHAHPPHPIALSIARPDLEWLPEGALSELILAVGAIPVIPYARPGTAALGEGLQPYLPNHRALILSRHGVICWGETLAEAYHGVERLEHASRILCLALQMGGITQLPDAEIAELKAMRKQIGERIL